MLVTSFSVYGQTRKKNETNFNCQRNLKFSVKDRFQNYPFDITKKVVLVSFEEAEEQFFYENKLLTDFKFKEIKTLNLVQIDSLIDLLYNIGVKGNVFKFTPRSCYSPRNAILFLNSNNKIFESLEICFECHRTKTSSEKINDGISCEQKFDLLRLYFKKQGIKYGVDIGL